MIDFRSICDMNGFSSYLKMILKAIQSQNNIFYLLVNNNAKSFNFLDYVDLKKIKLIYAKSKPFSIFSNIEIPLIILNNKIEIYHATNFNIPLFIPHKCYLITTIHDLIPIKYKNLHKRSIFIQLYLDLMFRLAAKISNKILTVSNYSKKDIHEVLKVPINKIYVTYCSFKGSTSHNHLKPIPTPSTKLLFVGTNFEHKNIHTVIEAVKILKDNNYKILFNIVGAIKPYTNILKKTVKELNLTNEIKFLGKISEKNLDNIYLTSNIYVFPSLVEGFGSPLLEAMNYGLPIISSNKTVMPEVVGNAGILIDPTPENFAKSIESLIKNPKLANDLVEKGYKQMKKFSQDNFNNKLNKIYNFEG